MMQLKTQRSALSPTGLLVICVLIAFAGWFKLLLPITFTYLVDYLQRAVIIVLIVAYGGFRFRTSAPVFTRRVVMPTAGVILVTLALFYIQHRTWVSLPILGDRTYHFYMIDSGLLFVFDMTVGLLLVAVSEELLFRYLFVRTFPSSMKLQYFLSVLLFGFLHTPQGWYAVAVTGATGVLDMWLYRKTQTLVAPIASHYVVDLVIFSGFLYAVSGPSVGG
ncbi:MAG: CPBP family intramembrane metalloprotease [Alphaproteobacteria bacterium]|nr:CPBP family intramembrane metalloprotease [Alphaproteobacteria bacterium]MBF0252137.1 CPBP family intramembrane metalloprotease [Alphaproteobacteria bacterium]